MIRISGISLILLLLFGCHKYSSIPYSYEVPETRKDGIDTKNLSSVELDTTQIFSAVRKIKSGKLGEIHSFLIYKKGSLVLEEYFPGHSYSWKAPRHHARIVNWNSETAHSIMSVTKSITSACIGIAIDNGLIKSADQSIFDYLPEHQHLKNAEIESITIEHLLTMSSGLDWTEWNASYTNAENPIIGIWYSEKDPVTFILDGNMVTRPGSFFSYYGGNQILLGEIIRNASGIPIDEFSQKYLFDPLGIDSVNWSLKFENGVIEAAGGLIMTPREILKIGVLYANDGVWNDRSIISKDWIEKSGTPYFDGHPIKIPGEKSGSVTYGYSWWLKQVEIGDQSIDLFWAGGWGGQKIYVIPTYEMVIVFTGGNYGYRVKDFSLVKDFILPAVEN